MSSVSKLIEKESQRNRFSDYLPYLAFDQETAEFINSDSTFGYLFECTPGYFVDEKTTEMLSSIIKQDYGKGAILQFILFADTDIRDYCKNVVDGDVRQTPLLKKISKYHSDFLQDPSCYAEKIKGNQLKNYRLFVCLKTTKSLSKMALSSFYEGLLGASLSPSKVDVSELLNLLRKILNSNNHNKGAHYDPSKDIASQAIFADTKIDLSHESYIKINDEYIATISPKEFPDASNNQTLSSLQVNELTGSFKGEFMI